MSYFYERNQLPCVFFGMEHIGGPKELKKLVESGEIKRIMKDHTIHESHDDHHH